MVEDPGSNWKWHQHFVSKYLGGCGAISWGWKLRSKGISGKYNKFYFGCANFFDVYGASYVDMFNREFRGDIAVI